MYCTRKLTEQVTWVGGSDRRLALFENLFPVPHGVSYNSYVIMDEKTAVLDTADSSISRQFLENVLHTLDGRPLDYLVVNHMEPDHCANIEALALRFPGMKIVGNAKTFTFMKQFYDLPLEERMITVKEGDTLSLGSHTLHFYMAPMVHWPEVMVSYDSSSDYPQIYLGNDKFGLCNDYVISNGRDLSYLDVENSNQVCVLGAATAEYLFSFADPVDKTISINGTPFRVVGVYKSKGSGTDLGTSQDAQWMSESIKRLDRMILLPSTMTRLFNDNQPIQEYVVKVKNSDAIKEVTTSLNGFLSGIINTNSGSYSVYSEDTWQNESNEANAMQQRFLGGIAAISLLVGGIGIMNIMLVTVTERTREIGIRKAIGAERKSIVVQFLIEAAMICGIGGIFGLGVGYIGTLIVGKLSFGTILIPSAAITVAAAAISVALGIIFGMYPAIKASGLQPVVALRAE